MLRSHICFILTLLAVIGCVSAASPLAVMDASTEASVEYHGQAAGMSQPISSELTLENRVISLEQQQNSMLEQQTIISRRLDAIIDHVKEIDNDD